VDIEDASATVRGVVFPDAFEKLGALLKEDTVLFFRGTVDRTSDRPGIQITEAVPAEDALARLTASVKLRVNRDSADATVLKRIKTLCDEHHGECPVFVELAGKQGPVLIRTAAHLSVRADEAFVKGAMDLLGQEGLQLAARPPSNNGNSSRDRWRRKNGRSNGNGLENSRNRV